MKKQTCIGIVTLISAVPCIQAFAQQGAQNPAKEGSAVQSRSAAGTQQSAPQTIDLATAKKIAAVTEAAAAAMNQHIAICVLDGNSDVVYWERMDGVNHMTLLSSQAKARAALMFGIPTGQIADAIRDQKPISVSMRNPPLGASGEITLGRGGLPIMKDGKLIGAVGAGGSASENDEKFAQAGVESINSN